MAHNYTQGFATGGEAHVFEDESRILEEKGHEVYKLYCSNSEATDSSVYGKLRAFWFAPWSPEGYSRMAKTIKEFKPEVIHLHNFFLIFSPSVFKAAHDYNVPIVVTLHNYRMVSPCSQLLRNGSICEKCVGRNPWRILIYRCYRNSFLASLLRYRIYYLSRKIHKWEKYVDNFIALTEFGKEKLIKSGLPAEKISVVPNCVADPILGEGVTDPGYGALFVGTLTVDKGVRQLIEAWREINYPLTVVGDGNLKDELERSAPDNVKFIGVQKREEVAAQFKKCSFFVMPSIWYEGFGLVNIEAMAMGRGIAVSGHGAVGSVVEDGVTGLHFVPGDVKDMQEKINRLISEPGLSKKLGLGGRDEYLQKFTPARHYQNLMKLYKSVVEKREVK
jgi:glycosyltransferase involved in cell wall biosynthesis